MEIDVDAYYREHGPMVMRRCRTLLGDEARAAEAMQETFVALLRNRDRLHHAAPSSLLYRIATNVCLNQIRSEQRPAADARELRLRGIADGTEPHNRSVAQNLLDKIFAAQQETTAYIAVRAYVDGATLDEIAREVGMSVSGVRKRLGHLRTSAAPFRALALASLATVAIVATLLFRGAPESARSKGTPAALTVYRKTDTSFERLAPGDRVRERDVVQLGYRAPGRAYGAIFSVDAAGNVTFHLPEGGGAASRLQAIGETLLPSAFELDSAPGFERFVLVTSEKPFDAAWASRQFLTSGLPRDFATLTVELKK